MGATALADNAYLKRRRGKQRSGFRWYIRVPVPIDIQETVRKQTIERALNTSDIKEARRLKLPVLAEIFEGFERTRNVVRHWGGRSILHVLSRTPARGPGPLEIVAA